MKDFDLTRLRAALKKTARMMRTDPGVEPTFLRLEAEVAKAEAKPSDDVMARVNALLA